MRYRIFYLLVGTFFITMNVLLFRSEFGWQKILTAPDNSKLGIEHGGVRVGYATWSPSVGEELATGKQMTEEVPPEGMVKALAGYNVDFEARLTRGDFRGLKLNFDFKLDTSYVWREMFARLTLRPAEWSVRAVASAQSVSISANDGEVKTERSFHLADLQNPEKLLRELGGPFLSETVKLMGVPLTTNQMAARSPVLQWEAHNDRLQVGHSRMRVYRLQARLLGRFQAVIYVNPVGEILRVELPDHLVLVNESLTAL